MNMVDGLSVMSQQALDEMKQAFELVKAGHTNDAVGCLDRVLSLYKGMDIMLDEIIAKLG